MIVETREVFNRAITNHYNPIGKRITGVLAGAIYVASQKQGFAISQQKIADAGHLTTVTLRNRVRELMSKQ